MAKFTNSPFSGFEAFKDLVKRFASLKSKSGRATRLEANPIASAILNEDF